MDASELDYYLPKERIARYPSERRDESRLLVFRRDSGQIVHAKFRDLPEFAGSDFRFFRNNAAVLKGRIFAKKNTGAEVECLLLTPETSSGENVWSCMLKPGKRLSVGATFGAKNVFSATVLEKRENGQALVKFDVEQNESVISMSEKIGVVPLPPYIERDQHAASYDRNFDNIRYETVYADPHKRVAAAAPTAGLHFTNELVERLRARGNEFYDLTLHVGIGTFQPLKSDVVEEHKMHSEIYEIPAATSRAILDESRPKLAVGTTSLRAMEDFCRKNKTALIDTSRDYAGSASLFVYPPQRVISADAMITNFHLPRSTLMCLVAAFLEGGNMRGIQTLKNIYKIAIENEYNFYSYGDAMLIL